MVYFPTFTIKINQMQVNKPYMDGIGHVDRVHGGNFAGCNFQTSYHNHWLFRTRNVQEEG